MSAAQVTAVFDCMVYLQGAGRRHGPARRCLELVDAGHITLCLSPSILLELTDVLARPLIRQKFPLLTAADAETLLRSIRAKSQLFTDVPNVLTLPRDRNDEIYLDVAVAAKADYLVTWNERHLTYLMQKNTPEGKEFGRRFPDLTILDPVRFLQLVTPDEHPKER
ncbi:MAG: putative toxin-antitoxin system toxin component, PIN family [Tepidisphaeraceae bacterium]|jgi:putative PIN family toxin of toxin-antitoxin system